MAHFVIKRYDTVPQLEVQIIKESNEAPLDLTGASASFTLKQGANPVINQAPAFILEGTQGRLAYRWQSGDTATPGLYAAEFQVVFPDGKKATFPSQDSLTVLIAEDLDGS